MTNSNDFITQVDEAIVRECMLSNDDLGIVLRIHLELERAMIRVLEVKFPNYAALRHDRFSQHFRALQALGAQGGIFQIAAQINKIRNDMAHVKRGVKTTLSQQDLRELYSQASGVFGGLKDIGSMEIDIAGVSAKTVSNASLAQQLAIIGIMAAAAIDTIPQREKVGSPSS